VPPKVVEAVEPVYPAEELDSGAEPTVILDVRVSDEGTVTEVAVHRSVGPHFDRAAMDAVRKWTLEPARRNGEPVPAQIHVQVQFERPPTDGAAVRPDGGVPRDAGQPSQADDEALDGGVPPDAGPASERARGGRPDAGPPSSGPPSSGKEGSTETPARSRPRAEATDTEAAPEPGDRPENERETEHFQAKAEVELERMRSAERGASDFELDRDVLEAAPSEGAAEMLSRAPSVFIARAEGQAVAHRVMLRGFDAEHGQDIEFLVDGVPVNQPSHIHGQGYADLGFIIPETVRSLRVTEGVYDPRQGDFATAGTVDYRLGVEERGVHLKSTYGSFDTYRQLLMWAPEGMKPDTFGAATFSRTDGFGENRGGQNGAAFVQYGFGEAPWRWRVNAGFYGARYNLAGVVRFDDVRAGRVGFYEAYDQPTAQSQNAFSGRAQLALFGEHRGADGENSEIGVWTTYNDFRIQENFTGYLQRSRHNPAWTGRGDLIEQQNQTWSIGVRGRHRTAPYEPFEGIQGTVELGIASRLDLIDQEQNLLQAPQNETWDERVDASVTAADIGMWLDLDWELTEYLRLKGGVRADVLYYRIDDRLGNFIPRFRRESFIVGFRRTALGLAAGPRTAVEIKPLPWLAVLGAYGEGYRSPQARQLEDGEDAPFAKVRSADWGVRLRLGDERDGEHPLSVKTSGYWTTVSNDVAFSPREGRLERIGPTTRFGWVLHAQARPVPWLLGALSTTYVNAAIDEPPLATASNPDPAAGFEEGSLIPYVPPWVVRADVSVKHELVSLRDSPLFGHVGTGYSFLSPRPLPFGEFADPVSLFDARAGVSWRNLKLEVQAFNLLDERYAATEFTFVSDWDPSRPPSRVPARHIAAGSPLKILVSLGVTL
jgi:TonB family protein